MYQAGRNLKAIVIIVLLSTLVLTVGCDKDDEEKTQFQLSATADGAQEVPSVTTNGSGTASGSYDKNTNLLTYTVTWKDLSGPATMMHFHGPAAIGESAGVALPIEGFTAGIQGSHSGTATLTEAQETDLLAGKWYYNVHTDLHKPGEVRGQLSVD